MTSAASLPSVSRQLIANLIGRAWVLFSNFLFLPVYLHVLGILNFGVVALFMALASLVAFLDLGLAPTLARELNDQGHSADQKQDLLYSYELAFSALAVLIMVVVVVLPIDAFQWLVSESDFARPEISQAMRLVFLASIAQLWLNFYLASLLGVEQHVKANALLVAAGIVRSALVILPLWIWPSPSLFLWWQLLVALGVALVARGMLYRLLDTSRHSRPPVFDARLLLRNSTFSGAVLLISITAAVNTQIDKVFIGRMQGLEALSAYSLVITVAQLLVFGITPITLMLTPRLVRIVSSREARDVTALFELAHRFVAALVCAGVGFLAWFGPDLIALWTAGKIKAETVSPYMPMLVLGYGFLALQMVPHSLALAHKNMRGSLVIASSIFLTVPGYGIAIERFGAQGAAGTWLVLQACIFPLYFCWVLKSHTGLERGLHLLYSTVLLPLAAAWLVAFAASHLIGAPDIPFRNIAIMAGAALVCTGACAWLTLRPCDRSLLMKMLNR